jgi:hypothetical protein
MPNGQYNETKDVIESGEFCDQLSDYYFFKISVFLELDVSEVRRKGGVNKCMQTAVELQCDREHCQASASVRDARSVAPHSRLNIMELTTRR